MICSDYFKKSKRIEIKLSDIDEIEGGVLSGTPAKSIYIHDGKNDILVGISPNLRNSSKLITIILSNVNKSLYDYILLQMKELNQPSLIKDKKKAR